MKKFFYKIFPLVKITFVLIFIIDFHIAFTQSLNDGLLLKYEFNGNAKDTSGNGFDGIVNATSAEDRNGTPNSCYYFNGVDNYIDFPNSSLLKPQLPVSISFWVNFTSLEPGVLTTDFAQDIHTGVWVSLNSEHKIAFNFGDGGSAISSSRRTKIGETILETGKWYHVLGVVRGANDMDIFINGINDCGIYTGSGGSLQYSTSPGSIGRKDSNTTQPPHYFHGYFDEFNYWKREVGIEEVYDVSSINTGTDFTSFEVPGQVGPSIIDSSNHTIEATIACGASLNIAPNFILSNTAKAYVSDIEQISGATINNFSNEVIYTVKTDLNCSSFSTDWTVNIDKEEVSDEEAYSLTSFSNIEIENQRGQPKVDSLNNTIDFEVDCGANLDNLLLEYKVNKNSIFLVDEIEFQSGNTLNFSKPIEVSLVNDNSCVQRAWKLTVHQMHYKLDSVLFDKNFFVPNIITPNKDGDNEYFKLGNLLLGSTVTIVNRHGITVFSSGNYQNNFCGCDLASGVYYYAIENNCYSEVIKGPLTILK